jgi:hypothetical protein
MIGVSLLAYRTAESAVRVEVLMEQSVSELQTLNLFFDSALVAAQRRADDLRETQRRQLDSLRALRQR